MSEYEAESSPDNLVDCLLDPAYCVVSDADPISSLLQQGVSAALPHSMTGSILICELVVHRIGAAAPI